MKWILPRLKPTPFKHFTDPVLRSNPAVEKVRCILIRCRKFPQPTLDAQAKAAQETAGWRSWALETPHLSYITHPTELADILFDLAA